MAGINSYTNLVELIRDYYDLDVGTYYNQSITLGSTTLTCDIYRVSNNTALTSSVFTRCTSNDANTQIVIGKNLSVASGVTLRPPYRCKGIIIGSPKTFTNNGTISMTARGASGEGKDIPIFSSYKISAVGGAGGAGVTSTGSPVVGNNGKSPSVNVYSCGGGGSGSANTDNSNSGGAKTSNGGTGTSFSGGSGSGGVSRVGATTVCISGEGSSTGGAGGNAAADKTGNYVYGTTGGAGNPPGADKLDASQTTSLSGQGTGGLIIILSENFINSGNIEANGVQAKYISNNMSTAYTTGGSSGGGCVFTLSRSKTLTGTITATGGATASGGYNNSRVAGKGGDGSVANLTANNLVLTNGEDLSLGITESQYLSQIPIVSGRLVALSDKDEMYYEYDDTRHRVGSGHNVKNSSSTTLETRSSLKFDIPFTVTDDSTNDATVIGQLTLGTSDLADFDEPSQASTGVTNISQMADVAISSATSGQALVFNGTKWANSYRDYHEYSTTEKVVGKWVDGKIVYEKVFKGTLLSSTGSTTISIGSNISSFIDFKGFVKNSSSNNDITIPYTASNGQTMTASFLPNASTSSPKNLISINNNISSFVNATYTIIVQYTKV